MSKPRFIPFVVFAALFLHAQAPSGVPRPAPPQAAPVLSEPTSIEENVEYGVQGGQKLVLDIYHPTERTDHPRPAVILIHGGGWISFDKGTMQGMGRFLSRSGFVAFAVDYRLFHGTENRWPAQLDDVQRSVRWVRANAAKYGVDADHVGAFGHSSGAQLAALLGMEDTRDNSDPALAKYSSRVQAVVDVSGPSDFTRDHDPDGDEFMQGFLGGDYAHHPDLWKDASPVFHVSKSVAPFLIVHGTKDDSVPVQQAEELYQKLQEAGVSVKIVKVDDVHTFQTHEARERLVSETLRFFNQYLY